MRRGEKRAGFVAVAATILLLTGTMAASAEYDSVPPPPGGTFVDDDQIAEEGFIEAIAGARITLGCNPPANDRFCPEEPVARGQMAAFLVRGLNLSERSGQRFIDDDGSIFEIDIERIATAGITKGCNPPTNDRFCPDRLVTRGQMAAFLNRALNSGLDTTPDVLAPSQYFGPGLFFNDNNANLPVRRVGSTSYKVLQSFRAPRTGDLTGIRAYLVGNPGYASGTGGKLEINVWPTSNSDPLRPIRTGEPLSSGQYQLSYTNGYPPSFTATWPLISLTANQPLTAGSLYYVEFRNIDPDPVNNWVSVNALTALKEHQTVARHLPISDWSITWEASTGGNSTFYDSSGSLYPGTLDPGLHYFPSSEYKYDDGTFFGNVRLEPGNWGSHPHDVDSGNPVRERFQIKDRTTITGAEIHTAARVAGELLVHFKLNGTTVSTATLSEQSATFYTSGPNVNGVYDWHSIDLGADAFSVAPGDTLDIEMVAVGSSVWVMSSDRTGLSSSVGFSGATTYGDSSAQIRTGSSWVNTLYYDHDCGSCDFGTSHFRVILERG